MAKSKFFRVAVEGDTIDGRVIERAWLEQMAANYVPATYTARANFEHIKGFSPDGPFKAYGDVLALKTEMCTLKLAGQDVQKLGLYAQIEGTDELVAYNEKKQKVFSSIEVEPNFAKTGTAYLMGLAFTDNPASLGTEALSFAALKPHFDSRKTAATCVFTPSHEIEGKIPFESADTPAAAQEGAVEGFFARLSQALFSHAAPAQTGAPAGGAQASTPAATPAPAVTSPTAEGGTFSAGQQAQLLQLFKAQADDQDAARKADFAGLKASIDALASKLDATPEQQGGGFSQRPAATGAAGELADF